MDNTRQDDSVYFQLEHCVCMSKLELWIGIILNKRGISGIFMQNNAKGVYIYAFY